GRSEKFIGRVIAGQRDRVFLASKVWPSHVTGNGIARACEASLTRLGTDHLDLYLLHWPNGVTDLSAVVTAFENLRSAGRIRAWGVSNFKIRDMENLFRAHAAIAVRPIRFFTTSATVALSVTCCHGASSTACRLWPIRRLAAPALNYCMIPRFRISVQHTD